MKIALFSDFPYGETVNICNQILNKLFELNTSVYMDAADKQYIDNKNVLFTEHNRAISECDVIISIGGDGTVTKYAGEAALYGKPILGINGGHLGFLTGIEKNEINELSKLIEGDYKIKRHMLLKAEIIRVDDIVYSKYCVNDAVIGRFLSPRMIDVRVMLDGHYLGNHRADGVIISTPTGSTAYSMSAGGPVVDPHIECMIFTPICAHSLSARSVICSSESAIEIVNNADDEREISLVTDSCPPIKVDKDCIVRIKKAEIFADFIYIKKKSFYEVLNEKMIERNTLR